MDNKQLRIYSWRPWFPPETYSYTAGQFLTTNDHKKLIKDVEQQFQLYLGSKHVVLMPSGTAALFSVLHVLLPESNGEVLLQSLVCQNVPYAIQIACKNPRFLEIESETLNIDDKLVEDKITDRTEAIIAIHQFGNPCNMDKFSQIARKYKLLLIEDSAQALGAEYKGVKTGSIGDVGILSFNNKVIDACGGGAIVTNNEDYYNKLIQYRDNNCRLTRKGYLKYLLRSWLLSEYPGLAFELAAKKKGPPKQIIRREINLITPVLLKHLLPFINYIIEKRRSNAALWTKYLTGDRIVKLPQDSNSSCAFYTIKLKVDIRDKIKEELQKQGIYTSVLAESTHKKFEPPISLPVTDEVSHAMLSFPTDAHIGEEEIKYVSEKVNRLLEVVQ